MPAQDAGTGLLQISSDPRSESSKLQELTNSKNIEAVFANSELIFAFEVLFSFRVRELNAAQFLHIKTRRLFVALAR